MKKFLMIALVLLVLPVIGLSQTVGDSYTTNTQTATVNTNTPDTLIFELPDRLDSSRDITLAVNWDFTDGTADSADVRYSESFDLTAASLNSEGSRPVDVVTDSALTDASWGYYNIQPLRAPFIHIILEHTELGSTVDTSSVQVFLYIR